MIKKAKISRVRVPLSQNAKSHLYRKSPMAWNKISMLNGSCNHVAFGQWQAVPIIGVSGAVLLRRYVAFPCRSTNLNILWIVFFWAAKPKRFNDVPALVDETTLLDERTPRGFSIVIRAFIVLFPRNIFSPSLHKVSGNWYFKVNPALGCLPIKGRNSYLAR